MPLYIITSPQGKQYVGITTLTVNRRMTGHKTAARHGSPYPLHAAIRKYGFDAMRVEVLHDSTDMAELHRLEAETIAERNTQSPNGYNLTAGGEGTLNHAVTEENRVRLSKCMLDRWNDPDFVSMRKQKASEQAKKMSPEHRSALNAGGSVYWSNPENHERRTAQIAALRAAEPERFANQSRALIAYNTSEKGKLKSSETATVLRASQTSERRREIAILGVKKRTENKAQHEAYLNSLPPEEAAVLREEARAKKSAETKAGRAKATPEQKAVSKERYRQAALRRHAAKKAGV